MISVITINYNNIPVTREMLASLSVFPRHNLEVIVVDNGSKEHAGQLATEFPWIHFVRSEVNLGFAGGNNLGVSLATGDYLFFVNNDVEFTENLFEALSHQLVNHPEIGAISPILYYYEEPRTVQYAGFTPINRVTGRNRIVKELPGKLVSTAFAHGAAMMMPREVYDKVGPMPENYFLYYEEMDWCEQIKRLGYRIAVDGTCSLLHKESRSVGLISELKSYFMSRNRLLFMRRNSKRVLLPMVWLYFVAIVSPKQILSYAFKKQWANAKAHLAGIWWNLTSPIDSTSLGYKFNHMNQS
ncbi:MAG: glycosyltransferase family 2 protein [Cyclobacteriaceae bacterium]